MNKFWQKSKRMPKGFKEHKLNYNLPSDYQKDKYTTAKAAGYWDVIVIGSGMGGLSIATMLAKLGKKVMILERHTKPGGCLHTFGKSAELNGKKVSFEYETGYHYVGESIMKYFKLNTLPDDDVEFVRMGYETEDFIYDRGFIGDRVVSFPGSFEKHIAMLKKEFSRIKDIDSILAKFYSSCEEALDLFKLAMKSKAANNSFMFNLIWNNFDNKKFDYYRNISCVDFLKTLTNDEDLINSLLFQFGDLGMPVDELSFALFSALHQHYYTAGAYFPKGNTGMIVKKFLKSLYTHGDNRCLTSAEVTRINVNYFNNVTGVTMANGDIINCGQVVSTVGVLTTYKQLLNKTDSNLYQTCLRNTIQDHHPTFTVFLAFDGSKEELKIPSFNSWMATDSKMIYKKDFEKNEKNMLINPHIFFLGFGSAKEGSETKVSTGNVITFGTKYSLEVLMKYKDLKVKRRGDEYNKLKDEIMEEILQKSVYRYYPHLKDKIIYKDLATPLTYMHYLNYENGQIYGLNDNKWKISKEACGLLNGGSDVGGLFLGGQDALTAGVSSAWTSAIFVAFKLLGYDTLDLLIGRDFTKEFVGVLKWEKEHYKQTQTANTI